MKIHAPIEVGTGRWFVEAALIIALVATVYLAAAAFWSLN